MACVFTAFIICLILIVIPTIALTFERRNSPPESGWDDCPQCNYNLQGLPPPAPCPECGLELPRFAIARRGKLHIKSTAAFTWLVALTSWTIFAVAAVSTEAFVADIWRLLNRWTAHPKPLHFVAIPLPSPLLVFIVAFGLTAALTFVAVDHSKQRIPFRIIVFSTIRSSALLTLAFAAAFTCTWFDTHQHYARAPIWLGITAIPVIFITNYLLWRDLLPYSIFATPPDPDPHQPSHNAHPSDL
ncbi:MAG: hypothetical protein KF757_00040 [Phycisphaeraceae bacterium]|nr:hypothetical protein [Phycisphaeraceae bacterium]